MQLTELREFVAKRGWQLAGEFVDVGVSGSKESRPQLDAMMRRAKTRKLDVIAVWKLDRFGRSLRHVVDSLEELKAVGCAFVSLRDNLDLTTPAGRMMFHVIGAMAEFERELIRERVRAGLAHARSKGQKLGRPRVRRDRDHDAKTIRKMRAEGQSYSEIADELGRSKADRDIYLTPPDPMGSGLIKVTNGAGSTWTACEPSDRTAYRGTPTCDG